MPRVPGRLTEAEVRKVIRGAEKTRVPVMIDFLPDGTIRVHVNAEPVAGQSAPKRPSGPAREIVL